VTAKGLRLVAVFALLLGAAGCAASSGSSPTAAAPVRPAASASVSVAPSAVAPAPAGDSDAAACKTISDRVRLLVSAAAHGRDNPGLKELLGVIKTLRETAPSAIRGDLQVIADFDQNVVDTVLSGGRPDIGETPQLTAALRHEAAWTATHCGSG
jgi:hypothetical protein